MANYPYSQLSTPLDTTNLDKLNGNWSKIEADIKSVDSASQQRDTAISIDTNARFLQQRNEYTGRLDLQNERIDNIVSEVSSDAFDLVVDSATVRWREPVDNFAALATTYPDATNGDAAQTLDDNKTYRFDGTTWVFIQQFGSGPFTDVYNRLDDQKYFLNVKFFGAVGDGVTDDTVALQAALTACKSQKKVLRFERNAIYKITSGLSLSLSSGDSIAIEGNGSLLQFPVDVPTGTTKLLEITDNSTTNLTGTTVSIKGLNFSGIGVPEQWSETVYANLKQLWALTLRADKIILDNLEFDSFYGYGIKIRSFQDATITNIKTNNVGGSWFTNDTYDAYGDSIYVGGGKQPGNRSVVDNVKLIGYPSDRPRKSRIGLTFETNVEIVEVGKVYVEGYNRNIHIENCPAVVASFQSIKSRRGDLHFYVHTGYKAIRIDGWDVDVTSGGSFGTLVGLLAFNTIADTERFFEISKGTFSIKNDVVTNFATERVSFVDCNFNSSGGRQQINGGFTVAKNCRFVGRVLRVFAGEIEALNSVSLGVDTNPVIDVEYSSSRGRIIWIGGEMKDSRIQVTNVPYAVFENFIAIETKNYLYSGVCTFINDFGSKIFVKDVTVKCSTNDSTKISFADSRTTYLGDSYRILINNTASKILSSI